LARAIQSVRQRGGIVVVVAHRPSALAAVDHILVMSNGRQVMFGPREEVLRQTLRDASSPRPDAPPRTAPDHAQPAGFNATAAGLRVGPVARAARHDRF
jgi:ATP-binding cassette subfamily C protein